jgi:hypothetical protein
MIVRMGIMIVRMGIMIVRMGIMIVRMSIMIVRMGIMIGVGAGSLGENQGWTDERQTEKRHEITGEQELAGKPPGRDPEEDEITHSSTDTYTPGK